MRTLYVFDIDGTLVDSTDRQKHLLGTLLTENKIEHDNKTLDEYMTYKADGNNTFAFLMNVLGLDESIARKINNEWIEHIEDRLYLLDDVLYSDTVRTLEALERNNVYFLTSRSNRENAIHELDSLGILKYAAKCLVVDPHDKNGKYNAVKKIMKVYCGDVRVILVGDTENEYDVAQRCHLNSYILARGFRSKRYWNNFKVETHSNLDGLINKK